MDAILLPSRSKVGEQNDFIRPSRTSAADQFEISAAKESLPKVEADHDPDIASPDDVYKALGSKPSIETVLRVLKWLQATEAEFRWKIPSPKAGRITNLLVNNVLPDHWTYLQTEDATIYKRTRKLLLRFLTSLTGVSNLVTRLQALLMYRKNEQQQREGKAKISTSADEQARTLRDVVTVLQSILAKEGVLSKLWDEFEAIDIKPMQRGLLQKEVVNLLAGSRVLSVSAEVFAVIDELSPDVGSRGWVGDGQQYTSWLASNIKEVVFSRDQTSQERRVQASALFTRAMSLGYVDHLVKGVFWDPTNVGAERISTLRTFLDTLQFEMQRSILYNLIRIMSQELAIKSHTENIPEASSKAASAVAAFLSAFIQGQEHLRAFLTDWVTDRSGGSIEADGRSRRAVIAVLAQHQGRTFLIYSLPSDAFRNHARAASDPAHPFRRGFVHQTHSHFKPRRWGLTPSETAFR